VRTFLLAGLTGGIATGKSTVSAMFAHLGCKVTQRVAVGDHDLYVAEVVAAAELELVERPAAEIRATVAELQARRKASQPTDRRTFGSVFKNPAHDLSAGEMIAACGLRGHRVGGAQISPKHANFIENVGGARTADVLALIGEARRRARERFGVVLEPEVQLLGPIEIPAL